MSGGPHGARVYWPAGLEQLAPAERAAVLERGWWRDGDEIVTRDGRRLPASSPQAVELMAVRP